jgi:hypothetical protein
LASNPSSFIALTALSSSATGLTYTNTTGVFSLTAGYVIPTTSSATNWDTAYTNRITSATAPLSITSNVISISQATTSTNGYLSSTDWTTFNNKSNTSGTVTSVSGAGTVSGLTLTGTVTTTGSLTLGGTLSLTSLNVTTALGFTPVTNARTLTINGTTYDLTADRSWTIAAGISTLTTLGTSGPATLVGSTLNVPNYSAGSSAVRNVSTFTATSGQTTFTIIGGYTVGLIDVFINGARLSTVDFTATNSSTVVLGTGAVLNDIVDVVNYTATFTSGITGTGTANFLTKWTGTNTVNNSTLFDNGTSIGIGTIVPDSDFKMVIYGTNSRLAFQNSSTGTGAGDGFFVGNYGLNAYVYNYEAGTLQFGANNATRMIIDSSGNVGINTTSPQSIFHVFGTSSIVIPVGTTGQRNATLAAGMIRINSTFNKLEFYNNSKWNIVDNEPTGLTLSDPIVNLQLFASRNPPEGMYYFAAPLSLGVYQMYYREYRGNGWVRVFSSVYGGAATVNLINVNLPLVEMLIQRNDTAFQATAGWSDGSYRYFNTRTATELTTSGDHVGYRVYFGNGGGHGIYNISQTVCNWGEAIGAVGGGYDGAGCGTFPNAMVWGTGQAGTPLYANRTVSTWETWIRW